jgi:inosine-uridine nucleoside N-ribohydrolase
VRVHLDTDLGGDTDDVCALAMLLGWPDAELVGVTSTIDPQGWRAGYIEYCLALAGRCGVPVAAGAAVSMTTQKRADPIVADERYWPTEVLARSDPAGAALDLLAANIAQGATVVAIGPYTNLALLELMRPGSLARAPVVVMGGWVDPPAAGLPAWGPDMDFNVQWDTLAAQIVVAAAADLTLVTLPATLTAHLCGRDLPRLREGGPLAALIARQSETHGADFIMASLGAAHTGLPDDLLNFQYDPVTCAVALGWAGATLSRRRLLPALVDDHLVFRPDERGSLIRVVDRIDGPRFARDWIDAVAGSPETRSTGPTGSTLPQVRPRQDCLD